MGASKHPAISTVREFSIRPQRKLLRSSFVKVFNNIIIRLYSINLLLLLVYWIKIPPTVHFVKKIFYDFRSMDRLTAPDAMRPGQSHHSFLAAFTC